RRRFCWGRARALRPMPAVGQPEMPGRPRFVHGPSRRTTTLRTKKHQGAACCAQTLSAFFLSTWSPILFAGWYDYKMILIVRPPMETDDPRLEHRGKRL